MLMAQKLLFDRLELGFFCLSRTWDSSFELKHSFESWEFIFIDIPVLYGLFNFTHTADLLCKLLPRTKYVSMTFKIHEQKPNFEKIHYFLSGKNM